MTQLQRNGLGLSPDQRQILRNQLRTQRRCLTQAQQQQAAALIGQRLLQHPLLQQANHIALYLAFDGEVETRALCQALWLQKKQLYLPTLNRFQPGQLLFMPYRPDTPLQLNRFGLQEPSGKADYPAPPLQVMLVPLVAFDRHCYRLGMGGGYYDRTLKIYLGNAPYTIGMAHDCQQITVVPRQPWDVPLSAIMTPTQWLLQQ